MNSRMHLPARYGSSVIMALFMGIVLSADLGRAGEPLLARNLTRIWPADRTYGIHVDCQGNVYVCGDSAGQLFLKKFDKEGTSIWEGNWGNGSESAFCVVADATSNVYVSGYTSGSFDGQLNAGGIDNFLTKFDTDGHRIWTQIWGSSGDEFGGTICLDYEGNIYVAGSAGGSFDGQPYAGGRWDLYLKKFNPLGTGLWTRIWGSSSLDGDDAMVSFLPTGMVCVASQTQGAFHGQTNSGAADVCLTLFDLQGNVLTSRIWGSSSTDSGLSVTADESGNLYVVGLTFGAFDGQTALGNRDAFLSKWSPSLPGSADYIRMWTRIWGSTAYDHAMAVKVGASGHVYAAGVTSGAFDGQTNSGSYDIFLTEFDGEGNRLRTRIWGSTGVEWGLYGLAVDTNDNPYVTGFAGGCFDNRTQNGGGFYSRYERDYRPMLDQPKVEWNAVVTHWGGAYGLVFDFETTTHLLDAGGWHSVPGCTNIVGAETMAVTNAQGDQALFIRVKAREP